MEVVVFLLFIIRLFIFFFFNFNYNVSWCGPLFRGLSVIPEHENCFLRLGKFSAIISSNNFSSLFLFSFQDSYNGERTKLDVVPDMA